MHLFQVQLLEPAEADEMAKVLLANFGGSTDGVHHGMDRCCPMQWQHLKTRVAERAGLVAVSDSL